jgi:hypothetical protein
MSKTSDELKLISKGATPDIGIAVGTRANVSININLEGELSWKYAMN